ncbi:MAG TPA: hypothetical protein VM282_13625 [Acidimicrobiales bacterium]|nr:hypothetical protein [Acidimicrobiales bacterium]
MSTGAFLVGACGGDDTSARQATSNGVTPTTGSPGSADSPSGAPAATGSVAVTTPASGTAKGSLTLGSETVTFTRSRCFLRSQIAAGETIEWNAQAFGANASGAEVMIDVSRYAKDSRFAGDRISVTIGNPASRDATNLEEALDIGRVSVEGSILRASGFELAKDDGSAPVPGAFEIRC